MTTTWDAGSLVNVSLSNGNLTARCTTTSANPYPAVLSTTSKSSGKVYFEITLNSAAANDWIGTVTTLAEADGTSYGTDTNGFTFAYGGDGASTTYMLYAGTEYGSSGASSTYAFSDTATNNVVGIALDLTGKSVWLTSTAMRAAGFSWNGNNTANPATPTGGYALTSLATPQFIAWQPNATHTITLNTGATSFNFTVPTGFSAWDSGGAVAALPGFAFMCG